MIVVGEVISSDKLKVTGLYKDGSTTVTIASIDAPNPELLVGKDSILYLNTETNELFYEYIDRPLTDAERVLQLEEKNVLLQAAVDDLILNGGGF